jgi:hypothetical protein
MGQQQLLLLVLSTVIVGLATVAGIQAFSENQEQATQDALVQRGLNIASQIKSVANKPSQFGGIDYSSSAGQSAFVEAANLETDSDDNIVADGAGNGATCSINGNASSADDLSSLSIVCSTAGDDQQVQVSFTSDGDLTTNTSYSGN